MGETRSIYTILLLAVLSSAASPLVAQSPFDTAYYEEALRIREELEVFTDRSLYVVNETIRFRADQRMAGLEGIPWSDVLYVELLSSDGTVAARAKYPIEGSVSRGDIPIPSESESGIYYLKCYTRWMRNRGAASYTYVPLKIVNPFRPEIVHYANGDRSASLPEREPYLTGLIDIEEQGNSYAMNEEALFMISAPGNRYLDEIHCCVTIAPVAALDTLRRPFSGGGGGASGSGFVLEYLPDLGGASIGGRVVREDGSPGAYSTLHFTLSGSDPGYYVTSADEQGRFILSTFGSTGDCEVFVVAQPYDEQQVEVRIEQDFDRSGLELPAVEFALAEKELEVATEMAIRMQLSGIYSDETTEENVSTPRVVRDTVPFYGNPGFSLEMDEYVDLPFLDEVFENLVPMVRIARKQGKREFVIESENNTIALYPTLVMVDYLPVFDHDAVAALSSEKVHRIEVINEVYIRGNVTFGGVISIISRQGNMAGIDLPEGSYFFDFQALEEPHKEEPTMAEQHERYPDTRNTLLWIDDLVLERGEAAPVRCRMPDQPGEYVLLVRSLLPGGEVHAASARFRVE